MNKEIIVPTFIKVQSVLFKFTRLATQDEVKEAILYLDDQMADCDFTADIINTLIKSLQEDEPGWEPKLC